MPSLHSAVVPSPGCAGAGVGAGACKPWLFELDEPPRHRHEAATLLRAKGPAAWGRWGSDFMNSKQLAASLNSPLNVSCTVPLNNQALSSSFRVRPNPAGSRITGRAIPCAAFSGLLLPRPNMDLPVSSAAFSVYENCDSNTTESNVLTPRPRFRSPAGPPL